MTRLPLRAACFALCVLSLVASGLSQEAREVPKYDARTFYDTIAYFGASFSADEKRLLITSDASGVFNAYSVLVESGDLAQLTDSKTSAILAVAYFPHDDRILYTSDEGGNELNHIYVRETDGRVRDLTPGSNLKASFTGWSGDLKSFYVLTNERDRGYFDCYRYDASTCERALFFKNTGGFGEVEVSRDGQHVALLKTKSNTDNDIYVWSAAQPEKEPRKVTPHEGEVEHRVQTFSPDSKLLYYGSNEDSEFNRVWSYDLASGERKVVASDNWDVVSLSFSWNGRYRTTSVNADARTATTVVNTQTDRPVSLPKFTSADAARLSIARSENLAAFYVTGDTAPADLYVMDLRSGQHRKLASSLTRKFARSTS